MEEMTLDELVLYIRKNVPQPKAIKHLVSDEKAKIARFEWQGRHFVVQSTLQTFELKKTSLFITGTSMLLQVILTTKTSQQTVIGDLVEKFDEAMNLLKAVNVRPEDVQKGLTLLQPIKATLGRMAGQSKKKKSVAA